MTTDREPIYPTPEEIKSEPNATPLAKQMASPAAVLQTGLIHIYTGDGKGKTTASVGLTIRAHAHGLRIMFVQFLKNGLSGEIGILRQLGNIRVYSGHADMKFTNQMEEDDKARTLAMHREFFAAAVAAARNNEIDLLVLDEAFGAISTGLLDSNEVYEFLRTKPATLEVVLTGRNPEPRFLALADYISRIECLAHPYAKGILAREGIDY